MAAEDTTELPIFREIETAWFHERGHSVMQGPAARPPARTGPRAPRPTAVRPPRGTPGSGAARAADWQ